MSDFKESLEFVPQRREFLRGVGMTASAALFSGALDAGEVSANQPSSPQPGKPAKDTHMVAADKAPQDFHSLDGINPKNVVEEYKSRGLAAATDARIYREVGAIVSRPPQKGLTSFTLHAPLELMARYGLLRLVAPSDREFARLQMVASAAAYGAGVKSVATPAIVPPFADVKSAAAEFSSIFKQGDADAMEALVLQIAAQFGTSSFVHLLTPLALPTLTGASHSHIGLWLLLRHGEPVDVEDASLLRAAARAIAVDPKAQMTSFSGMAIEGGGPLTTSANQVEKEILEKLSNPPRSKGAGESIQNLVEAGERTGNADRLFGEFICHDLRSDQIDAAFRGILRICALSMLQLDPKHAKFGWTHCLTLPQSACGLSSMNTDRKLALAAALVWTTAYRSVLSDRAIDLNWSPDKVADVSITEALHTSPQVAAGYVWHAPAVALPEIRRALATEASIRNDIHLVKYTRACLDMGAFDPLYVRLYLAAAAHLCSLWIAECPRATLADHLLVGRSTP